MQVHNRRLQDQAGKLAMKAFWRESSGRIPKALQRAVWGLNNMKRLNPEHVVQASPAESWVTSCCCVHGHAQVCTQYTSLTLPAGAKAEQSSA